MLPPTFKRHIERAIRPFFDVDIVWSDIDSRQLVIDLCSTNDGGSITPEAKPAVWRLAHILVGIKLASAEHIKLAFELEGCSLPFDTFARSESVIRPLYVVGRDVLSRELRVELESRLFRLGTSEKVIRRREPPAGLSTHVDLFGALCFEAVGSLLTNLSLCLPRLFGLCGLVSQRVAT